MKKEFVNAMGKTFLTIEYDAHNKWIYNNWIGYQTVSSIVLGANACIEYLEKYKCAFILNDNRLVSGPWNHSNEWIALKWMPQAVEIGLRYFAHVVNYQTLAATSAEEMNLNANGLFNMRIFDDYEKARSWLKQSKQLTFS